MKLEQKRTRSYLSLAIHSNSVTTCHTTYLHR